MKLLDLSFNEIKILPMDSFDFTYYLENLCMKFNNVQLLNSSLNLTTNLRYLDLSYNQLENIDFEFSNNISYLDLSNNQFKVFEINPTKLYKLRSLKLSNTNASLISNIDFNLFQQLEEIDLSDNLNINVNLKNLRFLTKLNLKNTKISDFSFLNNLKNIEELDISNNKISSVISSENFFRLKFLKISNITDNDNNLYRFYSKSAYIDIMIHLDASFNNISSIDGIKSLINLKYLDLNNNIIDTKLYDQFNFYKFKQLEFINLNKSLAKSMNYFELMFANTLEHAIISSIDLKIFPKFCKSEKYEEVYSVTSNAIDINLSCKLKKLFFDKNKLVKLNYKDLMDLESLEYLNLDSNNISLIENKAFKNSIKLETLILSNNQLDMVNNSNELFNYLSSLKNLNLSSNKIEILQKDTFSELLKLEVIDLSYNKLYRIKEDSFRGLVSLNDLYLYGNDEGMQIENSSLIEFNSIKKVYIDGPLINNSLHKKIFIDLIERRNQINKTVLNRSYLSSFNLISLNESFYDCDLVLELIRANIQYNLLTDSEFNVYLSNCQHKVLKINRNLNETDANFKMEIIYLYLLSITSICFLLIFLIWCRLTFHKGIIKYLLIFHACLIFFFN